MHYASLCSNKLDDTQICVHNYSRVNISFLFYKVAAMLYATL